MIYVQLVRKAYDISEKSNIGLVRSEKNSADAFTKCKANHILQNGSPWIVLSLKVELSIYRLHDLNDFGIPIIERL